MITAAELNARALGLARRAVAERRLSAEPPGEVLFSALSGGHMYGFPSPDSDLDLRGCHVLPLSAVIGLQAPPETFEIQGEWVDGVEIDLVSHDLRKVLLLLLKNGGYVLEQIFSPLVVQAGPSFPELRTLAQGAITCQVLHHYRGFFRRQRALVAGATTLEAKSILYLLRVPMSGIEMLDTGQVCTDIGTLNERFEIDFVPELLDCKIRGEHAPVPEALRERCLHAADLLAERLELAASHSALPTEIPNVAAIEDFLRRARLAAR